MYIIDAKVEDVYEEFPFIYDWISTICDKILIKNVNDCKLHMFYHYGFFNPKVTDREEFYLNQYERCIKMKFDERLSYELSRTRVNVTVKIDNFMMTNRLQKGQIPSVIEEVVSEITKYRMLVESEFHKDEEIRKSIPAIDNSIVSIELVKSLIGGNEEESAQSGFDLDDILDKIANEGMDSLTDEEKDYLDKKSREM